MGNSAPLQFVNQHFPSNTYQWRPYSPSCNSIVLDPQKFLIDQSTGILAQRYSIHQFSSLEFQLNAFLFRKQHAYCLVTVYDILLGQTPSVIVPDCMVNEHNRSFAVILQRIPYRLADIGVIKFAEMTYILQQCFKGLQALFALSGKYYLIDEDLICFNNEGNCKIAINQSLAKNTPNITASFTQQTIIQQIFQILQSRLDSPPSQYYCKTKANSVLIDLSQALSFIQKLRKKLNIQNDCIQSLKSTQSKKTTESDSAKAFSDGRSKSKMSEDKRGQKLSLKNSRNNALNKSSKPPKTISSQQKTTQVSIIELEKRNYEQIGMSKFMRSSFKSISTPQKRRLIQFTEYSEKIKRKVSPRSNEKLGFDGGHELYGRFPKGPLFS